MPRRVLIVDPDIKSRGELQRKLSVLGYAPAEQPDVLQALYALRESTAWDVVLCDLDSTGLGSEELELLLRRDLDELATRLLVLSERGELLLTIAARHGVPGLLKPYGLDALDSSVKQLMRGVGGGGL